jgi:hypothetical protein
MSVNEIPALHNTFDDNKLDRLKPGLRLKGEVNSIARTKYYTRRAGI